MSVSSLAYNLYRREKLCPSGVTTQFDQPLAHEIGSLTCLGSHNCGGDQDLFSSLEDRARAAEPMLERIASLVESRKKALEQIGHYNCRECEIYSDGTAAKPWWMNQPSAAKARQYSHLDCPD